MMNPGIDRVRSTMKMGALGVTVACIFVAGLTGCGAEEEPVAVAPKKEPAPPPPPPAPKYTPVSDLMANMGIDQRITWEETNAPQDDNIRRSVLSFFDGFCRADQTTVASMLPFTDELELDRMVESGQWEEATDSIDAVELTAGRDPNGEPCVLALYETGYDFQAQLWYYRDAGSGEFQFESVACPPNMVDRLQGLGEARIASWFEVLEDEAELAIAPEEEIEFDKRKMYDEDDEGDSGAGGSDPQPSGPMGGQRRRPPSGPKRPAPRGPGFNLLD